MQSICVYCGSSDKLAQEYLDIARQLGDEIARRRLTLIYGAGSTGMMGALADAAIAVGGEVVGVIPGYFNTPQLVHNGLSRLEVVSSIHERKYRMAEIADAFIALPGGFGTLEELLEIITWAQIGLHRKPIGILNHDGFYDDLLSFWEKLRKKGFIYAEHAHLFSVSTSPSTMLSSLQCFEYPDNLDRWVNRDQ